MHMKSVIIWKTGQPDIPGECIITCRYDDDSFVSKDYWDGEMWSRHDKSDVIAWCDTKDILPYIDK